MSPSPPTPPDEFRAPAAARPAGAARSPSARGSLRLGRFAGTDVFVHWSWFVAAYFLYRDDAAEGASPAWAAAEYVAGFGLVLLHEFGHVLACRQAGGSADRVVLWPLGGLALVAPPPRPGATLWTIAAGPLVNLALTPALLLPAFLTTPDDGEAAPCLNAFLWALATFNLGLLAFNLLPVFPLDGGRILMALLWWPFGRVAALAVAAGVGVVAALGLAVLAIGMGEVVLAALAAFLALGAIGGLLQARLLSRLKRAARRDGPACPHCGATPPIGTLWTCTRCHNPFDRFDPAAACRRGGDHAAPAICLDCDRPLAPAAAPDA